MLARGHALAVLRGYSSTLQLIVMPEVSALKFSHQKTLLLNHVNLDNVRASRGYLQMLILSTRSPRLCSQGEHVHAYVHMYEILLL